MIYIIQAGDYIKVGVAKNISNRMSSIQTSNADKIILIATKELCNKCDDYNYEKEIHKYLSQYRVRGEWFAISLNKMNEVIDKFKLQEISKYNISEAHSCLIQKMDKIKEDCDFEIELLKYKHKVFFEEIREKIQEEERDRAQDTVMEHLLYYMQSKKWR